MAADTITHLGVKLSPDIRERLAAIEERQTAAVQ